MASPNFLAFLCYDAAQVKSNAPSPKPVFRYLFRALGLQDHPDDIRGDYLMDGMRRNW